MPANHTLTLTNRQENDLTDAVAAFNAVTGAQVPPGTQHTNDSYLIQVLVAPMLVSLAAQAKAANSDALLAALAKAAEAADKVTLNKVRNDLTGYLA